MASADVSGQRIGSYRLLFRAGAGGMGEVFVAERRGDDGSRTIVALKRLLPEYADAAPFVTSLREEARLAAQVRHRNVCRVLELVEDPEAGPVLVMEYLEGIPLRRLVEPTSDLGLIMALAGQACDGVDAIHQVAIHRDINPSNMIVTTDGTLKILDFGIARADDAPARTRTGQIKGTTPYLAPEQVLGKAVDRRVDVFALGVTVFELLTGVSPFRRDNEFLTLRAITDEEPPLLAQLRPDVPEPIANVITRAMSRDPGQRYPAASELGDALRTAYAPAATPRAVAAAVTARFELELDERRRRIDRSIDDVPSRPLEPVTSRARPLRLATATVADRPPLLATPPASSRRRRLWLAVGSLAGFVVVAAVVVTQHSAARDSPAMPDLGVAPPADAGAQIAVTSPQDAAAPPVDGGVLRKRRASTRKPSRVAATASGAPGYLTIASRPYATIFVDDQRLGVTPLYRVEVPSGRRRIRAECSCGETRRFVINVVPGQAAPARNLSW